MSKRVVIIQFHDKSNQLRPEFFMCVSAMVRSSQLAFFAAMLSPGPALKGGLAPPIDMLGPPINKLS